MSEPDHDILLVNRQQQLVVLDNHEVVPITHWMDPDGDDCEPEKAVTCVAGSDKYGWYTIELTMFDTAKVH